MGHPQPKVEPPLSIDDLYAAARVDFGIFVELAFPVLHPGRKLSHAAYLDVIISVLTGCARGSRQRVILNLPPGFMKSMLVSIMYTAWQLGRDPGHKFVCISYGDDLAHKHSAATRKLMGSEVYRQIFPGTILDKKAEDHLTTTKGGVIAMQRRWEVTSPVSGPTKSLLTIRLNPRTQHRNW